MIDSVAYIDKYLQDLFAKRSEKDEEFGTNITKAVSEAVMLGAARCYQRADIFAGINKNLLKREFEMRNTKLMITLLNGGKVLGSAVKFAKFYLIIDGAEA